MGGKFIGLVIGLVVGAAATYGYLTYMPQASMSDTVEMDSSVSAEEAHETREGAMKAIGGHLKALGAVAKGEMAPDAGTVVHAESLAAMSHTVKLLFAQELISVKSRAKPESGPTGRDSARPPTICPWRPLQWLRLQRVAIPPQ
jgi:hypothetical protein